MYLNDCGVPPPAAEGSLEAHPQPPVGRVRLDLDGAIVRHKEPRGTSTVLHGEIDDPLEDTASILGGEPTPPEDPLPKNSDSWTKRPFSLRSGIAR